MSEGFKDPGARHGRHLVVLSGAGISAESGLSTFRAEDGLWEEHRLEDIATPQAFRRDPEQVLRFYDDRRAQVRRARPNAAHKALVELEQNGFRVSVITQNIDDLHERAGSREVMHLHGEILKARSSVDHGLRYPLTRGGIRLGDLCDKGSQLRPDVVWFGEAVPLYGIAEELAAEADLLLIVGTSLKVMPASNLYAAAPLDAPIILIDPNANELAEPGVLPLAESAGQALPRLVRHWLYQGHLGLPDTL